MIKTHHIKFLIILAALTMVLSACTLFHPKPDNEVLESRVNEYMTAKINNDWAKVYTFFDPDYRKKVTRDSFVDKTRKVRFTSFTIDSIKIDPSGKEATVELKFDTIVNGFDFKFKGNKSREKWIKKRNQWFIEPKQKNKDGIFG